LPLGLEENATEPDGAVTRRDISYASPYDGGRVPAYLYEPAHADDPRVGLIVMPGLHGTRDMTQADGFRYASRGAFVITITPSDVRPQHQALFRYDAGDREEIVQTTIDLRRAIDVLLATGRVDPDRIGYIGFSHGAALGGILCGVDTRLDACALQSGGGLDFLARQVPGSMSAASRDAYLALMDTVDQINYIGHVAPASLLLQNGENDHLWTRDELDHWHDVASEPKQVLWYDAGHELNLVAADDLDAFLGMQLSLH
jgi:dienelactone hydrolase